jgi:hypothetical protein
MKTSTKIITLAALSASRRPPGHSGCLFWIIFFFIVILLSTLCSDPTRKEVTLKPYDDSVYIKCSTDSECEELHGHDMYGNPVGRRTYDIPTKGFKMPR